MIKLPDLERKQIVIIFTIIGLLTVFITLIVFLATRKVEASEYIVPEITPKKELNVSDFLIEKSELFNFKSEYYLIREQHKKWDWVQAEKYWINIKSILTEGYLENVGKHGKKITNLSWFQPCHTKELGKEYIYMHLIIKSI